MKLAMKIGNISFNGLCLAPMEEVSDLAFRLTCKYYGAGMVYTEMCHTRSLVRGKLDRSVTCSEERPVGIQVAGNDVAEIVEVAQTIESRADLIDINLGCPGQHVVASGYGSALLKNPLLIGKIISSLKESVSIPVTAKMRAGFSSDSHAVSIAQTIEKAGGDCVAIHPRTKDQKYSGRADWSIIRAVKENVSIPVIGNGDVRSGSDALEMFKTTSCDGIMIGRAAIGDPLIFKRIVEYLKENEDEGNSSGKEGLGEKKSFEEIKSTVEEKIQAFELYIKYAKQYDLFVKLKVLRQAQQLTRYMVGAADFRHSLSTVKDAEDIVRLTIEYLGKRELLV